MDLNYFRIYLNFRANSLIHVLWICSIRVLTILRPAGVMHPGPVLIVVGSMILSKKSAQIPPSSVCIESSTNAVTIRPGNTSSIMGFLRVRYGVGCKRGDEY